MRSILSRLRPLALVMALTLVGTSPTRAADDAALFEAFGGKAGLTAIAQDLVVVVVADPRIRDYFDNVSHKRLTQLLFEQFCVLTGGPCEYTGRSMKRSHEGLNIDRAAYNALVEDLQDTMDRHRVPFAAQNRLLAKLAPMYRDIEER